MLVTDLSLDSLQKNFKFLIILFNVYINQSVTRLLLFLKVFKQQVKWNRQFQCILFQIGELLGFQGLRDFFQMFRGVDLKSKQNIVLVQAFYSHR